MKVGELFVNLGITGADKTIGAITDTTKKMGGLASMSLEAKAAILAAMYGLDRLMGTSADLGNHLTNLSTLLGISARTLQMYNYAAQQVGVSNNEMEGSFKTLQTAMANIDLNKGAPEWMAIVAGKTGMDVTRKNDMPYMMQKLQEFAQMQDLSEAKRRLMLQPFLGSDNVTTAMMRNAFRPDVFAHAPIIGDGQLKQLDAVRAKMANLWQSVEMKFAGFTAKHGPELVRDVKLITDAVFHLADSLETLSTKIGVFQKMSQSVEGLSNSLKVMSELIDRIGGKEAKKGDLTYTEGEAVPGFSSSPLGKWLGDFNTDISGNFGKLIGTDQHPAVGPAPLAFPLPATNNVTQHLNFQHDGKDHKQVGHAHKKAIRDALSQLGSLSRGS